MRSASSPAVGVYGQGEVVADGGGRGELGWYIATHEYAGADGHGHMHHLVQIGSCDPDIGWGIAEGLNYGELCAEHRAIEIEYLATVAVEVEVGV